MLFGLGEAGREVLKIFFISKRYYTNKDLLKDRFGRLYHLPIELHRREADVFVAAIDYKNACGETIEAEGVRFYTIPARATKLLGLPVNLFREALAVAPDIIIASGDSHIGYVSLKIANWIGARFIYDVYDYYPIFLSNRIPGMKSMFCWAVKKADLVLCASKPLQHRLSNLNPHTLLIENGVDRTLFKPGAMNQAREKLGFKQNIPLIGYFGSITATRGPLLIDACKKLRDEMPTLQLVLAGRVSNVSIEQPWINYLGEVPQRSIPALIQACNVVTVPYAGDTFNSMAGACKIAEYLACGRPVVATRVSGHEQIFESVPRALCDPNPCDMARALRSQLTNDEVVPFPTSMDWSYIGGTLYQSINDIAG